ncbi:class I SAM-dependent methyltransferase [Roseiarcaceae bacterium H3SJ34-1]|uniref:class I SAM-dependent methyltransferase n=1 Tax=Terripilifer ovatus TaxID=3032367 RepID=UPI003AB97915|nr:class I SAM-dependent methyltransferase [Roseiarcaceae bacterium H3SJ34-1]
MDPTYVGDELELFRTARNWKAYLREVLGRYLNGNVAEIGAGIGATAEVLADNPSVKSWLCVEPDPQQVAKIELLIAEGKLPKYVTALASSIKEIPSVPTFDSIIYVDVLEHIEHDRTEVEEAAKRLAPGGRLVVLGPAWQFLFSEFDKSIGHYRRYTLSSLRQLMPAGVEETDAFYLDGVGFLASLANKMFLKQGMPTLSQIQTWDSLMVPVSRITDNITSRFIGRSVVIIWTKRKNG